MARRRSNSTFNLAFLDIMSCGFGAVVLVFLIIKHSTSVYAEEINENLLGEVNRIERDVTEGQADLVELRQALDATLANIDASVTDAATTEEEIEARRREITALKEMTLAREESLRELRSDIETLEEEQERLPGNRFGADQIGSAARSFAGEGQRQYLTGLQVGGERILILLDTSASMLDETLVNVIRRRNMPPARKREAPKWQRARATVSWLASQLPLDSRYQIYTFATDVRAALPDTQGEWLEVADGAELDRAVAAATDLLPEQGTSLLNVFRAVSDLTPRPDNIILVTDGLPTIGDAPGRRRTVSGRQREELFAEATRALPGGIPVNVVLLPLEGDPMAATRFWQLAINSGGSFMSPSEDWP